MLLGLCHVTGILQVLATTLDGNSVNQRFIKLYDPSADFVYKVLNPYAKDERFLFFFF